MAPRRGKKSFTIEGLQRLLRRMVDRIEYQRAARRTIHTMVTCPSSNPAARQSLRPPLRREWIHMAKMMIVA